MKHSCETALVHLVDLVAAARDEGEVALVASADMAAAFDTVDHTILGEKLQKLCNVSGDALQLLNSYLVGRTQRVVMSGERKSRWQPVASGVPQGSVLGPLLFALYTMDIGDHVRGCELVQYADEITIVVSAGTAEAAVEKANRALAQLTTYATTNRLAPEPSKTQLLAVGSHRRLKAVAELGCEMGKHKIRPSETIKVLGVLIDERLSWEDQAAAAARKALNAARTVKSAARYLRFRRDRGRFMRALAHPHLDYCQTALAGPTAAAVSFYVRAYHRTARIAARTERSEPALQRLEWPTWERRRAAARAAFATKVWHEREPAALRDLLPEAPRLPEEGMHTRAMLRGEMQEPQPNLVLGCKAFRIWAPRVINQVSGSVVFEDCAPQPEISRHSQPKEPRGGRPAQGPADTDVEYGVPPRRWDATVGVAVAAAAACGAVALGRRRARAVRPQGVVDAARSLAFAKPVPPARPASITGSARSRVGGAAGHGVRRLAAGAVRARVVPVRAWNPAASPGADTATGAGAARGAAPLSIPRTETPLRQGC
eukprot:gene19759-biopygen2698